MVVFQTLEKLNHVIFRKMIGNRGDFDKRNKTRKINTALTLICRIWTEVCKVHREGAMREEEEIPRGGNGIRVS